MSLNRNAVLTQQLEAAGQAPILPGRMDQQHQGPSSKEQLDAVLDAALNDLDDEDDYQQTEQAAASLAAPQQTQEISKPSSASSRPVVAGPEPPPPVNMDMGSLDAVMQQLFQAGESGDDPEAALDSFMKQLQSQLAAELEQANAAESKAARASRKSETSGRTKEASTVPSSNASAEESNVDRTISKLLNDMVSAEIDDTSADKGDEEAILQDMMKEFEKMAGGLDQDSIVDGMMQQLVSKDIMYEPMKQVTEKFPPWLEKNKEKLSEEEYRNRSQQYECFQKLVYVYENEPENSEKLMQLMQDVQEYGQPPSEIIQEIAPGLELDEEGVPKLNPMASLEGNEECRIM